MGSSNEFSAPPDDSAAGREHEGYLGLLNDEALNGSRAAGALFDAGVGGRDELLRANPSWLRVGTMRALLSYARHEFDKDPSVAHELTKFVLAHIDRVPPPSDDTGFLLQQLRGTAYKEHGNSLFMLGRLDDALDFAKQAEAIFSEDPFHVVYRASARVLVALVTHAQHRNQDAIQILDEAIPVFADHSDAYGYIAAVQVRAMIAFDEDQYVEARDLYKAARKETEWTGDEREQIRIDHCLAVCAMRLKELDVAKDYMTQALLGFSRLHMDSELQRAIWLTAAIEQERGQQGDLDVAMDALHAVYGRFLERGMVTEAARVLVGLGDVITELTNDVAYAKDMCAKLAVTLGRYDVPANVRLAVEHLRQEAAGAVTVPALRAVLRDVATFLGNYLVSPSAVFRPTLPE